MQIELDDITVTVDYDYEQPDESVGYRGGLYIGSITINGEDYTPTPCEMKQIESECWKDFKELRELALESKYGL